MVRLTRPRNKPKSCQSLAGGKVVRCLTRLIEPTLQTAAYRVQLVDRQLVWRAPQGSPLPDTTSEPDASMGLKIMAELIAPFAPEEML